MSQPGSRSGAARRRSSSTRVVLVWFLLVGLGPGPWLGCAAAPPSPTADAWTAFPGDKEVVAAERRILLDRAEEASRSIEDSGDVYADDALTRYLDGVIARLVPASLPSSVPRPHAVVILSPVRSAFVLPNGIIYVSSELLASLENEAELAGVLGHEIAHYVQRHTLVLALYASHSTSTVDRMKLARENEREADRLALGMMSANGYDPSEMIRVLRLLAEDEVVDPRRVYAWESHPVVRERIRDVRDELWAGPWRTYGDDGQDRYATAVGDLLLANAQLELDTGHLDRARASIDRHLALRPGSGRGYYLRAEYQRLTLKDGRFAPEVLAGYERAHALAPDDPKIACALGLLLEELGETDRARPILERYLALAPDALDRKLVERYLAEAPGS